MTTKFYNIKPMTTVRRKLRKEMPLGEVRLWRVLRDRNLGFKFRRQYSIGPFITDFCCSTVKLVIEVDGLTHENEDAVFYDKQRQEYLESRGFTVIRFSSAEMFTDLQDVVKKIMDLCKKINDKR
ncbi:MAG: endonuclease domain-containing protein [Candidatus Magasanikbacteria bacterium]|nr:endonuclease domain-containing protein [Candidatus Magasanikbacteria bacterium]